MAIERRQGGEFWQHPIVLLCIGFLLSNALGSLLSYTVQRRLAGEDREQQAKEFRTQRRFALLPRLSEDYRGLLIAWYRYLDAVAIGSGPNDATPERQFRHAVEGFTSERQWMLPELCELYGSAMVDRYDSLVGPVIDHATTLRDTNPMSRRIIAERMQSEDDMSAAEDRFFADLMHTAYSGSVRDARTGHCAPSR